MRASFDTDRTQVATQPDSSEHLDTLTEKKTNMTEPVDGPELGQRSHSRQQYDDSFDGNEVIEDDSLDETDVEKGDENRDNERAEQLKRKESKQKDPNLIEWDGPSDPENPQNWPNSKVI
jgi:MFS transporter, DHA1 family, multidrug resistance protein